MLNFQGYGNVRIVALLDAESNREDGKGKCNLADVVVEDENHNKYIIEIEPRLSEPSRTPSFTRHASIRPA